MPQNICVGCNTPIPNGSNKCPMCGAKVAPLATPIIFTTPAQAQSPILQTVTEVHHHHHINQSQPILIEATGKKWKKLYGLACLSIFFAIVSCSIGASSKPPGAAMGVSGLLWMVGIVMYIMSRVGAWWNHG